MAKVGRPLKFKTVEELQKLIDEYFDNECKTIILKDEEGKGVVDKKGRPIFEINPPTISGLARYLGFESRQSMYDYKERDEFSYAIKETTLRIEEFAEKQLFVGNPTGAIFWLKNKGWKDRQEHGLDGGLDENNKPLPLLANVIPSDNGTKEDSQPQ